MESRIELPRLPLIDLSLFDLGDAWRDQVAAQIDSASSRFGFYYIVGHGIDSAVVDALMDAARRFFAAEEATKHRVARDVRLGHGYLPLAQESPSDIADHKEALYFQTQLAPADEPVASQTTERGQVFLPDVPGFHEPVLDYMRSLTGLGHKLMSMIARGLLLDDSYFVDRYTGSPSTSFRIFNYPQVAATRDCSDLWARASHLDPGLLTILKQDSIGGLELRCQDRWVDVPDIPNSFVCVVGETLARLTNGRFVSAAHRVRNSTQGHRLSMPFCFDPSMGSAVEPIVTVRRAAPRAQLADESSNGLPELGHRYLA